MYSLKLIFASFILTYVFYVNGEECIYDDSGQCIELCPSDTYSYTPSCEEVTMSQRTCRSPVSKPEGNYCDYSRCDCREPKVWDETNEQCVPLEDCPKAQDLDVSNLSIME